MSESAQTAELAEVDEVDEADAPPRSLPPDIAFHRTFLWASTGIVFLALILTVRGEEQVIVPIVNYPLPGSCTYKQALGADCPGCGLTRCFISMAHGDFSRAWHFNPVGMAFFALVASQIPYRGVQIWRIRNGRGELDLGRFRYAFFMLVIAGLIVQWVIRTVVLMSS